MSWTIALLGTDTYIEPNTNGCVALSALDTTDPMTDGRWYKLNVLGLSPAEVNFEEPEERIGGAFRHSPGKYRRFEIKIVPLSFPEEMDILQTIFQIQGYKNIYLYRGTYDFSPKFSIHAEGECLKIAMYATIEDDYDNGVKFITIMAKVERNG